MAPRRSSAKRPPPSSAGRGGAAKNVVAKKHKEAVRADDRVTAAVRGGARDSAGSMSAAEAATVPIQTSEDFESGDAGFEPPQSTPELMEDAPGGQHQRGSDDLDLLHNPAPAERFDVSADAEGQERREPQSQSALSPLRGGAETSIHVRGEPSRAENRVLRPSRRHMVAVPQPAVPRRAPVRAARSSESGAPRRFSRSEPGPSSSRLPVHGRVHPPLTPIQAAAARNAPPNCGRSADDIVGRDLEEDSLSTAERHFRSACQTHSRNDSQQFLAEQTPHHDVARRLSLTQGDIRNVNTESGRGSGRGSAVTTPGENRSPEDANADKMKIVWQERMLNNMALSLEDTRELLTQSRQETEALRQDLAIEKARVCTMCNGIGLRGNARGLSQTQSRLTRGRGYKTATKVTALNDCLDHARSCPERLACGVAFVNATHAVFSKTAAMLCEHVVTQLEERRDIGDRVSSSQEVDTILQQRFLPHLVEIGAEDGMPVFRNKFLAQGAVQSGQASNPDEGAQGWSPKNPLHLATRSFLDGAALATPSFSPGNYGETLFANWTAPFCAMILRHEGTNVDLSDEEIEKFVALLAEDKNVATHVRRLHNKHLTDKKGQLTKCYISTLGFSSTRALSAFFADMSDENKKDRDFLLETLGVGGIATGSNFPSTYFSWKQRKSHSFHKWRTLSVADLAAIQSIAHRFQSTWIDPDQTRRRSPNDVSEISETLEVDGTDIICGTPEVRQILSAWLGRSSNDGSVKGDTSVIVVARADAYMAAWLAQVCVAGELGRKLPPHVFNLLMAPLIPEATMAFLGELRSALVDAEDPVNTPGELFAPFAPKALDDAMRDVAPDVLSLLKKGEQSEEYDKVRRTLDNAGLSHHLTVRHKMDFYMTSWRKNTVHFWDAEDRADYCVVTSDFVTKNVCCWIGKVRDGFVGVLDSTSNKFIALTTANGQLYQGEALPGQ